MKRTRLILIFLIFQLAPFSLFAQTIAGWGDVEPYRDLKAGSRIVYTFYDGKDKVQGYNSHQVVGVTRDGSGTRVDVAVERADRKRKVQNACTVSLRYSGGVFHVDMLDLLSPQGLENFDISADVSGREMVIPADLAPGMTLPEASATFKMKVKAEGSLFALPSLTFRIFDRQAQQVEKVETPAGTFVCFKIVQTVEGDYPIVGKRSSTQISWIAKGVGMVRTEGYDAKGKKISSMVLTEFEP